MLVIKNAFVWTGVERYFKQYDISIEGSKIHRVEPNIKVTEGDQVIDAKGFFMTPGLIDAHSHIGGFGSDEASQDLNEMTNPVTAECEAYYAIDLEKTCFKSAIRGGITTSVVTPGSGNVICGLSCIVKTVGRSLEECVIKNPSQLKMAMGGNPKGVYGKKNKTPMTRMGIASTIRENFIKAREYEQKHDTYNAGYENLLKVLNHEISVKVHCEQFDMMTVIELAKEFDFEFTLDHAWGASDYYDEISQCKNLKGVIYGPIGVGLLPGECGKVDIASVSELDRRGVKCCLMTDGPILNPEILMYEVGETIRTGYNPDRALELVTVHPAEILGIDDRVGTIEKGKDADLILWSARPGVETNAAVKMAFVNGMLQFQQK